MKIHVKQQFFLLHFHIVDFFSILTNSFCSEGKTLCMEIVPKSVQPRNLAGICTVLLQQVFIPKNEICKYIFILKKVYETIFFCFLSTKNLSKIIFGKWLLEIQYMIQISKNIFIHATFEIMKIYVKQ